VSSLGGEPMAKAFTSSDLVNRMWRLASGSARKFLSIPTDCPQRDERLAGWETQRFSGDRSYNFDIAAFSQKFIQDIVDAQSRQGAFTNVSPNTLLPAPTKRTLLHLAIGRRPGWATQE